MYKEWIKISDNEYTLRFHPNDETDLTATIERDFEGDWLLRSFDLDSSMIHLYFLYHIHNHIEPK